MKDFERAISAEFKVRLRGDAKTFLGMEINKNSQKGTVEITQKKYTKTLQINLVYQTPRLHTHPYHLKKINT